VSLSYKILSSILLSNLTPYADGVIADYYCVFRHNRSTTDHIFYICQILEKKWEYNGTVQQLFIDFKKTYDSVRRKVLYSILIEFGIPRKLDGKIKLCVNDTYRIVRKGKNLSDKFPVQNGLLLAYADDVEENIGTTKKDTEALLDASMEFGLKVNTGKTQYILMSHNQKIGQKHSIKTAKRSFEDVANLKYVATILTDPNCIHEEIKSRLNSGNACYHSVESFVLPPAV
jgi:hypothetical protein